MAAKNGRGMADIFTATTGGHSVGKTAKLKNQDSQLAAAGMNLAPLEPEAVIKTSMFFTQDQLDYLDDQTREIKRGTRATIKRTGILRALVQGMMMENVNLGACRSEADLAEAFRKHMPLKGGKL